MVQRLAQGGRRVAAGVEVPVHAVGLLLPRQQDAGGAGLGQRLRDGGGVLGISPLEVVLRLAGRRAEAPPTGWAVAAGALVEIPFENLSNGLDLWVDVVWSRERPRSSQKSPPPTSSTVSEPTTPATPPRSSRTGAGSTSPARTRSSASSMGPVAPQLRQLQRHMVPWTSTTRAGSLPARWCSSSMFWVMRVSRRPWASSATSAR